MSLALWGNFFVAIRLVNEEIFLKIFLFFTLSNSNIFIFNLF